MALHRIELLTDEVINQIAAGEVVERPSSVVKELLENAIDAGSSQVIVEIERGGMDRISVLDNGRGMSPGQAELALRRHATSKLSAVGDLLVLRSFGFRGEALPSIAAVSNITMTTRDADSEVGTRLCIEAGRIVERSTVGAPIGTHIEVRDLLCNIPARRKFLRAVPTEAGHIHTVVTQFALSHPKVHFRLKSQKRVTLLAAMHRERHERICSVLGAHFADASTSALETLAGVQVEVYLGSPQLAQSTPRGIHLFARQRPVRDRGLLQALCQGYGDSLTKGRYPVAVVFVDVPDSELDVNVHPQKLEVRFADKQRVFSALRHVAQKAVDGAGWEGHDDAIRSIAAMPLASRGGAMISDLVQRHTAKHLGGQRSAAMSRDNPERNRLAPSRAKSVPGLPKWERLPETREAQKVHVPSLRPVDVFDDTFYVIEADGQWIFVDKMIAHVCHRAASLLSETVVPTQRLLFASALPTLKGDEAGAVAKILNKLGFELALKGKGWACVATPAGFPIEAIADLEASIKEIAETWSADCLAWAIASCWEGRDPRGALDLKDLACWAAIPSHWELLEAKEGVAQFSVDFIRDRMRQSSRPSPCI